jgi:hypothetical protein
MLCTTIDELITICLLMCTIVYRMYFLQELLLTQKKKVT